MTKWKASHCSSKIELDDDSEFRQVLRDIHLYVRSLFSDFSKYDIPLQSRTFAWLGVVVVVVVIMSSDVVKFSCRSAKDFVPFMFGIVIQELCEIRYNFDRSRSDIAEPVRIG
jgi:hypothetical protein